MHSQMNNPMTNLSQLLQQRAQLEMVSNVLRFDREIRILFELFLTHSILRKFNAHLTQLIDNSRVKCVGFETIQFSLNI